MGLWGRYRPMHNVKSRLRAPKGSKYALGRARTGKEALRGFHRFAPLETCQMVTWGHACQGGAGKSKLRGEYAMYQQTLGRMTRQLGLLRGADGAEIPLPLVGESGASE